MNRRYGWVLIAALAGAVLVSVLLRLPRPVATTAPTPVAAHGVDFGLTVFNGWIEATTDSIEAGSAVTLSITNHASTPQRVRLAGYEDRVDTGEVLPGATWRGVFIADRPGEQFAWLVNDQPMGRLDIRGSHLVEGHR